MGVPGALGPKALQSGPKRYFSLASWSGHGWALPGHPGGQPEPAWALLGHPSWARFGQSCPGSRPEHAGVGQPASEIFLDLGWLAALIAFANATCKKALRKQKNIKQVECLLELNTQIVTYPSLSFSLSNKPE